MALGGIAELRYGVRAERRSLEDIAAPLSAATDGDGDGDVEEAHEAELEERIAQRRERDTAGLRRYRPGPGHGSRYHSPGMHGTAGRASDFASVSDRELDREIELVRRALQEHGRLHRDDLRRILAAHRWGPGRYRAATRAAAAEGGAQRSGRRNYAPPERRDPS
jgi:hypothetical protein